MSDAELFALIPTNKHDIEKAQRLITIGWPDALPALPALLTWLEDMNWPVAKVLEPFR